MKRSGSARIGIPPQSAQGQELAGQFWNMILEFTGGDLAMLPQLMELASFDGADPEWKQRQRAASEYIEPALETYFIRQEINPEGESPQ